MFFAYTLCNAEENSVYRRLTILINRFINSLFHNAVDKTGGFPREGKPPVGKGRHADILSRHPKGSSFSPY